jgi:hypothetical protein
MGVYQRVTDGLLHSLNWAQERLTDPVEVASGSGGVGR